MPEVWKTFPNYINERLAEEKDEENGAEKSEKTLNKLLRYFSN